jgi:hypothetical protein
MTRAAAESRRHLQKARGWEGSQARGMESATKTSMGAGTEIHASHARAEPINLAPAEPPHT